MATPLLPQRISPLCRRALSPTSTPLRQPLAAQICIRSRAYASKPQDPQDDPTQRNFKEQLWQSTTNRVQREKEEQARFSNARHAMNAGRGPGLGSTVGVTVAILMAAGVSYYFGTLTAPPENDSSTLPLSKTIPPTHNTHQSNLQAAWVDLKNIVGSENISTNTDDLSSHAGSSWSSYPNLPSDVPFAIVRPSSTQEVSQIMRTCHTRRIPVTAYSGGTSLEGHFASTRGGICIDFGRMDQILTLHEDDMDVIVQPSVGWESLNADLAEKGLFFPPDPGPGAMIGGMVGTGCSGTNAYRYGTMRDWVLSLTVVLADGTILKTRQRPRKSSAGYDLTRLFIGSEGTLGLVTEATLKVTAAPQNPRVAVCTFPSIKSAADCVFKTVRSGIPIAAVELLDDVQMHAINAAGSTSRTWKEAPTLFFKFSGTTPKQVDEAIKAVRAQASAAGSKTFEFARTEEEADELWQARKDALWSIMGQKRREEDHVWTTDVAVPLSRLPQIIEETKEDIAKSGLVASMVGHVGDGNFHAIILYGDDERQIAEGCTHRMVKRAVEMEGTTTGEHGVGLVKRDYLEHELGREAVDAMRAIKRAWDPLCLLNCDKVVRMQVPGKGEVQEW